MVTINTYTQTQNTTSETCGWQHRKFSPIYLQSMFLTLPCITQTRSVPRCVVTYIFVVLNKIKHVCDIYDYVKCVQTKQSIVDTDLRNTQMLWIQSVQDDVLSGQDRLQRFGSFMYKTNRAKVKKEWSALPASSWNGLGPCDLTHIFYL